MSGIVTLDGVSITGVRKVGPPEHERFQYDGLVKLSVNSGAINFEFKHEFLGASGIDTAIAETAKLLGNALQELIKEALQFEKAGQFRVGQ